MDYPSEAIEAAALADIHAAATPQLIDSIGLQSKRVGSALVSIAARLPASAIVINRAIGLGLHAVETEESVGALVEAYRHAGVDSYFVHLHSEARPGTIGQWLQNLGLKKTRGWQKFSRGREPVPQKMTDLEIREIGPEHGNAFAEIVCNAFDLGYEAVPWLARLPGREGWHIFMSFDGDIPAGAGGLYMQGDYAWTDFGATAPAYRRRGSQGALLARRVQYAIDAGCREIMTCTGEEVPGDPQHSYRNILKMGFRETCLRENYAP